MSSESLLGLFLGSLTASVAIAPAAWAQISDSRPAIAQATGTASDLAIPARLHVEYQNFAGDGEGYGRLEGLIPLGQTPGQSVTFFNPQVVWDATYGTVGGGLTIGHRWLQDETIFGGYVSYDLRQTDDSTFNQIGLGLEAFGDIWDVHLNGYLPVGDTRQRVGRTGGTANQVTDFSFQGNNLVLQLGGQSIDEYEAALGGLDLEGGIQLTEFANGGDLRGYGGLYYLAGNSSDSVVGGRVRLAARPTPFLNLGLGLQSDGLFGTRVLFSVGATFPGYGATNTDSEAASVADTGARLWARAGESITRNNTIWVDEQVEVVGVPTRTEIAVNPETGAPYVFLHVIPDAGNPNAGDGTIASPFTTLGTAGGAATTALGTVSAGNIVYVRPGDTATNPLAAFTIPGEVQVLSTAFARTLTISTSLGTQSVLLPESGTGPRPLVDGAGGAFAVSMTGGNNVLDGFSLRNAVDTLLIDGAAGAIARNNVLTQSTNTGISISNGSSNVLIDQNDISQAANLGILVSNDSSGVTLQNNTIATTGDAGIVTEGDNTTIQSNRLSDVGFGIIAAGNASLTIRSNTLTTVETNVLRAGTAAPAAITVSNATGNVAIDGNTITNVSGVTPVANLQPWATEAGGVLVSSDTTTGDTLAVSITNNTITDTRATPESGDAIAIAFANLTPGTAANPTATVTISGNTVSNIGTVEAGQRRGDGIRIGIEEDSIISNLTITNNTLSSLADDGLDISLGLLEAATVPGIDASNAQIQTATISGNQVSDVAGDGAIVRVTGSNSRAILDVQNNNLNAEAFAATVSDINLNGSTTLCLELSGNAATNFALTNGLVGPDLSVFEIVDLANLGANNTGTVNFTPGAVNFTNLPSLNDCP